MHTVRVTYTAKPEFVEQNKSNISNVMQVLRRINNPALKYATYLAPDGLSFMHFANFENEEAEQVLLNLPEFKHFQAELRAHGLTEPPKSERMSLVGSCFDIFS